MSAASIYVTLQQDDSGYPPWAEEAIPARAVDARHYVLEASPTFAKGLSLGDVVHVVSFEDRLYADRVHRHGGHSTIRVILFRDGSHDELLDLAAKSGVAATHTEIPGLFSIDVPPDTMPERLVDALVVGRSRGDWDLEVGALASVHEGLFD